MREIRGVKRRAAALTSQQILVGPQERALQRLVVLALLVRLLRDQPLVYILAGELCDGAACGVGGAHERDARGDGIETQETHRRGRRRPRKTCSRRPSPRRGLAQSHAHPPSLRVLEHGTRKAAARGGLTDSPALHLCDCVMEASIAALL